MWRSDPPVWVEGCHFLANLLEHLLPLIPQVTPDEETGTFGILRHVSEGEPMMATIAFFYV